MWYILIALVVFALGTVLVISVKDFLEIEDEDDAAVWFFGILFTAVAWPIAVPIVLGGLVLIVGYGLFMRAVL